MLRAEAPEADEARVSIKRQEMTDTRTQADASEVCMECNERTALSVEVEVVLYNALKVIRWTLM